MTEKASARASGRRPESKDKAEALEEIGGFVQRQPHHAAVAAGEVFDEHPGTPLDAVGAGLVQGFATGDVAPDLSYNFV